MMFKVELFTNQTVDWKVHSTTIVYSRFITCLSRTNGIVLLMRYAPDNLSNCERLRKLPVGKAAMIFPDECAINVGCIETPKLWLYVIEYDTGSTM